ncbi:MAG: tetratricopeptide repeat protein [Deltaproteobacteria bacterium]|nr:tetratricopeptide repeat protein [Deltaproteobacteria bacterium]
MLSRLPTRSIVLALAALVGLVGCGGASAQLRSTQVIALDPIEIKADRRDGKVESYVKDFDQLHDSAMASFKAGEWAAALRDFERLIRDFPDHTQRYALEFNAGLCLNHLRRHAEAAQRFADARTHSAGTRHARDALFLQAEALERAEKWGEAAHLYRSALEDPATQEQIGGKLGLLDELEAQARRGLALRRAGDLPGADRALRQVEQLYDDHRDTPLVAQSEWVARALYERAQIFYDLFASIRFRLPVERMQKELEDKSNLFLKSEGLLYRCVRLRVKPWSLAAGHAIGTLYTRLIEDIDNAEVPPDLDPPTMELYRDELWNHTERLAKRALTIFQKNIELAQTLGDAEWVEKSHQGYKRVEKLVESNMARRIRLLKGAQVAPSRDATPSDEIDVP